MGRSLTDHLLKKCSIQFYYRTSARISHFQFGHHRVSLSSLNPITMTIIDTNPSGLIVSEKKIWAQKRVDVLENQIDFRSQLMAPIKCGLQNTLKMGWSPSPTTEESQKERENLTTCLQAAKLDAQHELNSQQCPQLDGGMQSDARLMRSNGWLTTCY